MLGSEDDNDWLDIVRLARGNVSVVAGVAALVQGDALGDQHVVRPHEIDSGVDEELRDVVCVLQQAPARRYAQSSWGLSAMARSCKKARKIERDLEAEKAKTEQLALHAAMLGIVAPGMKLPRGLSAAKLTRPQTMVLKMQIASQPTVTGAGKAHERAAQNKAAREVRAFGEFVQARRMKELQRAAAVDDEGSPRAPPAVVTVVLYDAQSDRTSQRLRGLASLASRAQAQTSHGRTLQHVTMQHGAFHRVRYSNAGLRNMVVASDAEPYIVGGIVMEHLGTDDYLEALIPNCPLPIENEGAMLRISHEADAVVFHQCLDRASTNYCCCRYIWTLLKALPTRNIYPSHEPCAAHGAALVKSKSRHGKTSASALNSLSRLTRDDSTGHSWSDCIRSCIASMEVDVHRGPRPAWHISWAEEVLKFVFGEDMEHMCRTNTKLRLWWQARTCDLHKNCWRA